MSAFKGFSKDTIRFFEDLEVNNHKDWFDDHKKHYEKVVKHPSMEFVVAMGDALKSIAPDIQAIPKVNQSLFRLNRDVRFSKDKSPYKTHMGIWLWEGSRKRMENSGFYLHLDGQTLMLGAGVYAFTKPLLEIYRQAVVHKVHGPALVKTMTQLGKNKINIGGKHYKRIPSGYSADDPNAEMLLYNGFHAGIEMSVPDEFYNDSLIPFAMAYYKKMLPLHTWLKTILS